MNKDNVAWSYLVFHFFLQVAVVLAVVAYFTVSIVPITLVKGLILAIYVSILFAAAAFAIDRRVVADRTDWTPSTLYYLLSLPFVFNIVVTALYIRERQRRLRAAHSD